MPNLQTFEAPSMSLKPEEMLLFTTTYYGKNLQHLQIRLCMHTIQDRMVYDLLARSGLHSLRSLHLIFGAWVTTSGDYEGEMRNLITPLRLDALARLEWHDLSGDCDPTACLLTKAQLPALLELRLHVDELESSSLVPDPSDRLEKFFEEHDRLHTLEFALMDPHVLQILLELPTMPRKLCFLEMPILPRLPAVPPSVEEIHIQAEPGNERLWKWLWGCAEMELDGSSLKSLHIAFSRAPRQPRGQFLPFTWNLLVDADAKHAAWNKGAQVGRFYAEMHARALILGWRLGTRGIDLVDENGERYSSIEVRRRE
jgi:hypothetical protein